MTPQIITPSDLIDYDAEPCPYCGERELYLEFDEWEADGTPTETGTHVRCKNEDENDPRDHSAMPYVYWLPVDTRAARWARDNVRIVEHDDRARIADWNAGRPLPGGMSR